MRQQRKSATVQPTSAFDLSARDEQIIAAINRYFYLTAEQVTRLFYSRGSHTSVYGILSSLAARGYTEQVYLPKLTKGGKERIVNALARKGRTHLMKLGKDIPARLRKSERPTSPLFYAHTLTVNDFLIAAELLARNNPAIHLSAMQHELTLKREPITVTATDGKKLRVTPDGWLDFTITDKQGSGQSCVLYECDRDTEEQRAWREKVTALVRSADGAYQERFHTKSLTIAISTPTERRRTELIHWTETELQQRKVAPAIAELFHFTNVTLDKTDPVTLFLSPVWHRPFTKDTYPLLEVYLG